MKFLAAFCAVLFSAGVAHAQCVGQGGIPFNCAPGSVPGATDLFLGGNKVGPHANGTVSYTGAQVAQGVFSLIPSLSGGGTANFLRADGTWVPLAQSAITDTTNASNITTGTMPAGPLTGANASGANVTATGGVTARTAGARAADVINVLDMGAGGDGQIVTVAASIAASSTSLAVATNTFSPSDILPGCSAGAPTACKILALGNAGTTPTNGVVTSIPVATPGGGYATVPTCAVAGGSSDATCSPIMALQSATIVSSTCTGCTTGVQTFLVNTGTGTFAKLTATVSAGTISGISVASGGSYTALPTTLSAATIYGAGCGSTCPTVNLSFGVGYIWVTAFGTSYPTSLSGVSAGLSGGTPSVAGTLGTPVVTAPVPPLVTRLVAYTDAQHVTLAAAAGTTLSAQAIQISWGTDSTTAIQASINAANVGCSVSNASGRVAYIPGGIFWLNGSLDPGHCILTIRGDGLLQTVLIADMGAALNSGNPILSNVAGSASALTGALHLEDFQMRGLLDFGRVNVGAGMTVLHNYDEMTASRMRFFQAPFMALDNQSIGRVRVSNSEFVNVVRDAAHFTASCDVIITNNHFIHSTDDSISLHGAPTVTGPCQPGEAKVITGNVLEDTTGVHVLGGRFLNITNNIFRRMKLQAVNISLDASEGTNPMYDVNIADNTVENIFGAPPFSLVASAALTFKPQSPSAATAEPNFVPGVSYLNMGYTAPPWNYGLADYTSTGAVPPAYGVTIHDNKIMRSLPTVSAYSQWGLGTVLTVYGFLDLPVPDAAFVPTAGIEAGVNVIGETIHHNSIFDVRRGIVLDNNSTYPAACSLLIDANTVYDAWEYGIYAAGSGSCPALRITNNTMTLDPYHISPGRHGTSGGWNNGYSASVGIGLQVAARAYLSGNDFAEMYQAVLGNSSNQYVCGAPNTYRMAAQSSGSPNAWNTLNTGIGIVPYTGGCMVPILVGANPQVSPATYYGLSAVHFSESPTEPTTGVWVQGERVTCTQPQPGGTCAGIDHWVRMTMGGANVDGTDWVGVLVP